MLWRRGRTIFINLLDVSLCASNPLRAPTPRGGTFLVRPASSASNLVGHRLKTHQPTRMHKQPLFKQTVLANQRIEQKVAQKGKLKHSAANNASLQVVGCGSQALGPSLLLKSGLNALVFNCPEGLQRALNTHRIRQNLMEHIFMTRFDWDSFSGTFSFVLNLQDLGSPSINIHVPPGLEAFYERENRPDFEIRTIMQLKADPMLRGFKDNTIQITPIALNGDVLWHEEQDGRFTPPEKRLKLTPPSLIAYDCVLCDLPGALDPEKCRKLKIPIGPLLGELKRGRSVEVDGRSITPDLVMDGPNLGPRFLIVDCASDKEFEQLKSNQELEKCRLVRSSAGGGAASAKEVSFVVHFTPKEMVDKSEYREWMRGFSTTCRHIFMHNPACSVDIYSHYNRFHSILHGMDPVLFPPLWLPESVSTVEELPSNEACQSIQETCTNPGSLIEGPQSLNDVDIDFNDWTPVRMAEFGDKLEMRPQKRVQRVEPFRRIGLETIAKAFPEIRQELSKFCDTLKKMPNAESFEPEVVFLGTASARPGKFRNTSCIMINFQHPKPASAILDCGEDAYGQMLRFYGPERLADVLRQLKFIYVSHQHSDHHIGLIRLLRHRRRLTAEPISLILPPSIVPRLKLYDELFGDLCGCYTVHPTSQLASRHNQAHSLETSTAKKSLLKQLDGFLNNIHVVPVVHCAGSMAVVLEFNIDHPKMKNFVISYSGDAMPSFDFAEIGANSDLLIHEATFPDEDFARAKETKHSTTSEAIAIGQKMNAKFTILTHFTQYLNRIPIFTNDFDERVGWAMDNMAVRCPSGLARIPASRSIYEKLFDWKLDELNEKIQLKRTRERMREEILQAEPSAVSDQ